MQWPVEELNRLREKEVKISNQKLKKGHYVEVKGTTTAQVNFLINWLLLSLIFMDCSLIKKNRLN